jgi:short subunit dehydrogenase
MPLVTVAYTPMGIGNRQVIIIPGWARPAEPTRFPAGLDRGYRRGTGMLNVTVGTGSRDSGPVRVRARGPYAAAVAGWPLKVFLVRTEGTVMDRQVVLVTGASRGLGRAAAELLAGQGYQVFGTARRPSADGPGDVTMLPLDVTSDESVRCCVSAVLEQAGRIDVLVNNAGAGLIGAVEETPVGDARALFDANLFGLTRMTCAVLPGMRQRHRG